MQVRPMGNLTGCRALGKDKHGLRECPRGCTHVGLGNVLEVLRCIERPRVAKPELRDDMQSLLRVAHVDRNHLDQYVVDVGFSVPDGRLQGCAVTTNGEGVDESSLECADPIDNVHRVPMRLI